MQPCLLFNVSHVKPYVRQNLFARLAEMPLFPSDLKLEARGGTQKYSRLIGKNTTDVIVTERGRAEGIRAMAQQNSTDRSFVNEWTAHSARQRS